MLSLGDTRNDGRRKNGIPVDAASKFLWQEQPIFPLKNHLRVLFSCNWKFFSFLQCVDVSSVKSPQRCRPGNFLCWTKWSKSLIKFLLASTAKYKNQTLNLNQKIKFNLGKNLVPTSLCVTAKCCKNSPISFTILCVRLSTRQRCVFRRDWIKSNERPKLVIQWVCVETCRPKFSNQKRSAEQT